jgi:glycosyltransferase involved in cell wall biosynthesis
MTELSIIMPAYNEEASIAAAIEDVQRHIASVVSGCELIVVDDGSNDGTSRILAGLLTEHNNLRVITQANKGHGNALMAGMDAACDSGCCCWTATGRSSWTLFQSHWELRNAHTVILGVRQPRHDPVHRIVVSWLMRQQLWLLTGAKLQDAGAPYKLFHSSVWHEARGFLPPDCWIPSVLLAAHARLSKHCRHVELPVQHVSRTQGTSTLNLQRLARFCIMASRDLIGFAMRRRGHLRAEC